MPGGAWPRGTRTSRSGRGGGICSRASWRFPRRERRRPRPRRTLRPRRGQVGSPSHERRARPGLRVFYGWDEIPAPGEPVAGGTAKLQKLAERWPNRPTDFSLLYLGTTYLPRDLRPLLWLARRRRDADRRQPGRGCLSGLGRRPNGRAQRPAPRGRAGGRPRRLPERVLEALLRPLPGRARGHVGDPPERRRRRPLRARSRRRPTGRSSCSAATRRRATGSSSASRRSATSSTQIRRATPRQPAGSSPTPSRRCAACRCTGRSTSWGGMRRQTRPR